jgi:glycosyltransferase involved in cell wall biosynthesis
VLVSYSGEGGVERMINHLVGGLLDAGRVVDVVVLKREGEHFAALPSGARVVCLPTRHAALAPPFLWRYLRRARPAALLAAKDRASRAVLRVRRWDRGATRVVIRAGNQLSRLLDERSRGYRALRLRATRRLYPWADAIVAVSRGVADDVIATAGVAAERVHVVRNPTITPDIDERAGAPTGHAWLDEPGPPVILGIGRLARQKDFATLVRAFAHLRGERPARLVILGEGRERAPLQRLAGALGVDADVDLPGFVANPYAWLQRAAAFALSSAWEGSPNALTEAMYLGRPVVATDCPSGPAELLADGRIAPLVPVGDDAALVHALASVLDRPPDPDRLRAAVADYHPAASTAHYLEVLEGAPGSGRC